MWGKPGVFYVCDLSARLHHHQKSDLSEAISVPCTEVAKAVAGDGPPTPSSDAEDIIMILTRRNPRSSLHSLPPVNLHYMSSVIWYNLPGAYLGMDLPKVLHAPHYIS